MLMNTDLLRHQQQCKEGRKDVRNIMSEVEGQVCRFMALFVKHRSVIMLLNFVKFGISLAHIIYCDVWHTLGQLCLTFILTAF
jgi:hypothetical protein